MATLRWIVLCVCAVRIIWCDDCTDSTEIIVNMHKLMGFKYLGLEMGFSLCSLPCFLVA